MNLLFASALLVLMNPTLSMPQIIEKGEPDWQMIKHNSTASFRGVYMTPNAPYVWVSGSQGTVLRSADGGQSWADVSPENADNFDFRDIHGFTGGEQAVALAVGSPARIYRTTNQGREWQVVYQDTRPEIFLDAMAFWNDQEGIAFGDPIHGKIVILRTSDSGQSWQEIPQDQQPDALENEGGFAASGTCLALRGEKSVVIGLGGARKDEQPEDARILISQDRGKTWQAKTAPLASGAASGVFSIVFVDQQNGVAVGGTYDRPDIRTGNVAITQDGGDLWKRPNQSPGGYRSCVVAFDRPSDGKHYLIALGKTGADISNDLGNTWHAFSSRGFFAASVGNDGKTLVAVGSEGRIGVLSLRTLTLD